MYTPWYISLRLSTLHVGKMANSTSIFVLFLAFISVAAGYSCYSSNYYIYCYYGCCGSYNSEYCCSDFYYYDDGNAAVSGIVIGSVIGGLVFVGIFISVIICVVCKCSQRGPMVGRVFGRAQTSQVTASTNMGMVNYNSNTTGAYPAQAYPRQQTAQYGNYGQPLPMTQPTNPAYPPPSAIYTTNMSASGFATAPPIATVENPPTYESVQETKS